jgi:hypothetical protein
MAKLVTRKDKMCQLLMFQYPKIYKDISRQIDEFDIEQARQRLNEINKEIEKEQ